jgi:large subunit ribosomal protein L1
MAKKGKKYNEALEKIEANKAYKLEDAVALLKEVSFESFDASVELALRLNVDPRQADQNIRGATVLPNGTGKTKRVLVFAKGDQAKAAEEAGADFVGEQEMVDKVLGGWMDFDTVVATPDMMAQVGKLGRTLGPKGLMPNPKTGTVTPNVKKAVEEIKAGKVEYRVDKVGNLHITAGKVSFSNEKLLENIQAFYQVISSLRPSTVKGAFVSNASLSSTMSPGIKLDAGSMG